MGEISLRHIPDLDASSIGDFSDSSFQIPSAAGNAENLLLADDTMDFFDDTLNTPAPFSTRPPSQPPLTLAELTPRPKSLRTAPVRSPLRSRPAVIAPSSAALSSELSTALSEELSPFCNLDPSFQMPPPQTHDDDLLMADSAKVLFGREEHLLDDCSPRPRNPLTLSQLTPGPSRQRSPSVTPSDPPLESLSVEPKSSSQHDGISCATPDTGIIDSALTSTALILPRVSDTVPEQTTACGTDLTSQKGKGKALPRIYVLERQKKPVSDKLKRKRATPSAAISKPAKLKPSTAAVARRLSNSGKKSAPALRRRPLQGGPSTMRATSPSQATAFPTYVRPSQGGGLVDTLMSFGQKLIANAERQERRGEVNLVSDGVAEAPLVPDAVVSTSREDGCTNAINVPQQPVSESDYLTISQLSPQNLEGPELTSVASVSPFVAETLDTHQSVAPSSQLSLAERPPSPMRCSIKRAGSPIDEPPTFQRKRSKTTSGPSAPSSSDESKFRKPPLRPSRAKNALAAVLSSGPSGTTRTRRVVSAAVTANGADRALRTTSTKKPDVVPSRSLSTSVISGENDVAAQTTTGPRSNTTSRSRRAAAVPGNECRSGQSTNSQVENIPVHVERWTGGRSTSTAVDKQPTNLPPAKPTKPMEFQFATSSRSEARSKGELGSTGSKMSLRRSRAQASQHPIPDFKALHAAQELVLAQRRAEIHTTVPLGFDLATDTRAQEREKFDEARRAREDELERQAAERRRERELEEEAEIRELRRRAVPKANEVPEWYAFAPKKAKAETGS